MIVQRKFASRPFCLLVINLAFFTFSLSAQPSNKILDLDYLALVGTEKGIFSLDANLGSVPLWTDGEVRKIVKAGPFWFTLGTRGIFASSNLRNWDARNASLPVKTIKSYAESRKSFTRIVQELKDLEVNPTNPQMLVTATKDSVFLSRDAGLSWKNLGSPVRTNGLKAVAVASLPGTTVFVTHGIYGVYYLEADKSGAVWTELNTGLVKLETTNNPDEVADIAVALDSSRKNVNILVSQSFKGRIYRLDWEGKRFKEIWFDGQELGTIESLDLESDRIRFVYEGGIAELPLSGEQAPLEREELTSFVRNTSNKLGTELNCIVTAPGQWAQNGISLSELWLLNSFQESPGSRRTLAHGRDGLYLPVNHALDPKSLEPYLKTIDQKKLNMVVIDMKDDYGRLRFTPRNQEISAKGRVFNPVNVESFVATMKAHGVYLVARIVVFKDPELAKKEGGKYAVWDAARNAAWQGYYEAKKPDEAETVRTYYDENWVDPYSEEVWEYTADISEDLISRGFDEIQYDYIRFPTDGINLSDARYRWKDAGMDMESALLSFLNHVRNRIQAPISIDIYGANGWYRTGARTGQEVELLSRYVDVICPMYYPSHFEQNFLADEPAEQRPYRIYYRGTLRTDRIARGRVIVRPYVQSFFLNVSYDRKYYNADYVRLQVEGVRDAGAMGLTYWNNVGRYDEIPIPKDLRTARNLQTIPMLD